MKYFYKCDLQSSRRLLPFGRQPFAGQALPPPAWPSPCKKSISSSSAAFILYIPPPCARLASFQVLFRYRGLFLFTMLLAMLGTLAAIAVPQVVQHILQGVAAHNTVGKLAQGVALIVVLYGLSDCSSPCASAPTTRSSKRCCSDLRRDVHARLLELPMAFYDQRKSGENLLPRDRRRDQRRTACCSTAARRA